MAFVVIYDACVLHPAPLRDLLIRIARTGVVQAKWTDKILDECFESILRRLPHLVRENLAVTRARMNDAVPDVLVTGYENLIADVDLPDPNDRHVVAAAILAHAQVIVTSNLKDFPADSLSRFGLEAMAPDDFVLDCIDLRPDAMLTVVRTQAATLKSPPATVSELLDKLETNGLKHSVARLRALGAV